MNIVFLDYDGVVNSLMYDKEKNAFNFNFPKDNKVNNYQAVKLVERLCEEFNAKIVVTSTWRKYSNYKECLYNGGLSKDIEIIDKTEDLEDAWRIEEIKKWLESHPNVKNYVILDDDIIGTNDKHWVRTETYDGFLWRDYEKAKLVLCGYMEDLWKK